MEDKFNAQLFFNNKLVHLLEERRKKLMSDKEVHPDK
jgi:hypothetical protein